jgi:hypothetical protein
MADTVTTDQERNAYLLHTVYIDSTTLFLLLLDCVLIHLCCEQTCKKE